MQKFRYYTCPKCGSAEIEGDEFDYDDEWGAKEFRCNQCSFGWREVYSFEYHEDLDGYTLDENGERVKDDISKIGED